MKYALWALVAVALFGFPIALLGGWGLFVDFAIITGIINGCPTSSND